MKKETVLIIVVVLLAGAILGYLVGQKASAPTADRAPSAPPSAPTVSLEQQIKEIKSVLATDPQNRGAWVALGNAYFDANQFVPAIEAYDKALALDPDDANVLVDQGVMFRRLGWFDRAIENFKKATEINPNHATAWYNLGVVYQNDLKDVPNTIDAWTKFLEVSPNSPAADRIRAQLEALRSHPPLPSQ